MSRAFNMFSVIFSLILISGTALCCPDFSGKYLNRRTNDIYELIQEGCSKIEFLRYDDQSPVPTYRTIWFTDGLFRVDPTGTSNISFAQKAEFVGDRLEFTTAAFNRATQHYEWFGQSVMTLDPLSNVFREWYREFDENRHQTYETLSEADRL